MYCHVLVRLGGFSLKNQGGCLSSLRKIRRSDGLIGLWGFWVNPFTRPSLKEIGEMACVASARSSRGHARTKVLILKFANQQIQHSAHRNESHSFKERK